MSFFIYVVTFILVIFFLLLNFCLAIVVDTYSMVKEAIANNKAVQTFHQDVISLLLRRLTPFEPDFCVPPEVMWGALKVGRDGAA